MIGKDLEEIATELAGGYPSGDRARIAQEFQDVVEVVLPLLAQRASLALDRGMGNVTEIWEFIREDSESLFEKALAKVERVKVIFVASKFMNNKLIGELIAKQARDMARYRKENRR